MRTSSNHRFGRPTLDHVESIADDLGFALSADERAAYRELAVGAIEGLEPVARTPSFDPGLEPDRLDGRERGYRPRNDDPLNAWITRCRVEGAKSGPLAGVTVGVKDSIAVAGYEMTAGSRVLEGFVPKIDATVVSRLLDDGATIAGKLNMESFACSGRGDLSDFGAVANPHDHDRLPGGSSSGSGAAPANGDCDAALGTDQAGSVRIPSSWCGIVGLKPTYGLVPATGVLPLELSLDHVGPMAPSVERVARLLESIAGLDAVDGIPLDQRQSPSIGADSYVDAIGSDVDGLSIAVLEEGFGWESSEPAVDDAVRDAAATFEEFGVDCESVSVPLHRDGVSAWAAIATQGMSRLLDDGGVGTNHTGWAWTRLARRLQSVLESRTDELPPAMKRTRIVAAFLEEAYGAEPYAMGRNVGLALRRAYDEVLREYDALLLPTTITRAFERTETFDLVEALTREVTTIHNTCPFNVTGHPALSVPCAKPDGLPVGAMLVGSQFEESTLLSLAAAFERETTWEDR
ncbi:amidase [Natrarchaeobius oligotrophus]|uniref:Amidase n=1 Tax=Natrarchaeobius chitinivorans TaxID=1679083 RepID=A0A3N6MF18_NATCH|nr:amidase [Natrarchaeobius chitinivorans]RQH02614.1 amidase [Natrarchaeobius chitinivorans]